MAGVTIGDDRGEVIGAGVVLGAGADGSLPGAALVELEGAEELVDLVRNGCARRERSERAKTTRQQNKTKTMVSFI